MLQLPQIDLNELLPIAGLGVIAVVCALALILHGLLRSRVALLIAVVIGVVIAGPALASALVNVVWALVPLGIVLVGGVVVVAWLLHRSPDLMSLVRDIVPQRPGAPKENAGLMLIDQPKDAPAQLPARRVTIVNQDRDRWGF